MYITKVYEQLKEIQGDISKNKFCSEYLGTDRNYMNVCVNKKKDMSVAVLVRLIKTLRWRANVWAQLAAEKSDSAEIYRRRYCQYHALSEQAYLQLME